MSYPLACATKVLRVQTARGPAGPGVTMVRIWPCDPTKLEIFWGTVDNPYEYQQLVDLPLIESTTLDLLQDVEIAKDLVADPTGGTLLVNDQDVLQYDAATSTWVNQQLSVDSIASPPTYLDPNTGTPLPTTGMVMTSDGAGGTTWAVPPGGYTYATGVFGTYHYSAGTIPPGTIHQFAMSQMPTGWLACNGSTVDRVLYQRLFNAIGTSWGSGDGSTTFHLPAIAPVAVGGISNLHHGIHE